MATKGGMKMDYEKQKPGYWSYDGQCCFIDGCAWGVKASGRTYYMGLEEDVKKRLGESTQNRNEKPQEPREGQEKR